MERKILKIGIPETERIGKRVRLNVNINADGADNLIWFETAEEYGRYFLTERSDALLLILFYYAMKHGFDMEFEGEITQKLYYGIKNNLMPALSAADKNFYNSRIKCGLASEPIKSEGRAATGISCGVDSFATIFANIGEDVPEEYRLQYLTFFNGGAAYREDGTKVVTESGEDIEAVRIKRANKAAAELGLPIIVVDSNINEFLQLNYVNTHTFRNCAMAMLLGKLISKYYYSSAGFIYEILLNPNRDSAYYDSVSVNLISNGTTSFYSSLDYMTRFDKTMFISDKRIAQDNLNVCVLDGDNCGKCPKCIRTLASLDAMNKLDEFAGVFDIADYVKNRCKRLLWVVKYSDENFYDEIYNELKKAGKIPFWVIILGKLFMHLKNVKRFFVRRFKNE